MTRCRLGHNHADRVAADRCDARQTPARTDVEVDPRRPHAYVPPQLARANYCAVCGGRKDAALHVIDGGHR